VDVVELQGRFPFPDLVAIEAARSALDGQPDHRLVVIDGLALPAFESALLAHRARLSLVGFVHHPLALETGLEPSAQDQLARVESRIWSLLDGIVCPSEDSARAVAETGFDTGRIAVTPPGTELPRSVLRSEPAIPRLPGGPVRLLAVGTLIARKGHALLLEALAEVPSDLLWHLDCIGSLERDPLTVERVRALIRDRHLDGRVTLHGEVSSQARDLAYARAHLFTLPSFHEGYGMVFAEAMAWGLPIVATTGGAIPATVPADAGRLVPPGDRTALARALVDLIGSAEERARLARAARSAAARLADWPEATLRWISEVERLAA
jgi:glycosyltransferase involved in cell wall biosynthesis